MHHRFARALRQPRAGSCSLAFLLVAGAAGGDQALVPASPATGPSLTTASPLRGGPETCTPPAQIECEAPACIEYTDPTGDDVIRRAMNGNPAHPVTSGNKPDIKRYRIGSFAPTNPSTSLFDGEFVAADLFEMTNIDYFRFDLFIDGLVNPPGPLDWSAGAQNGPFKYGTSPIYANIEFNIDSNGNTGGQFEVDHKFFLANFGRFGQVATSFPPSPTHPYVSRTAKNWAEANHSYGTDPQVKRTGSEWFLRLNGVYPPSIPVSVIVEKGSAAIFEAGEVWEVPAYFGRSTAYEFGPFWTGSQSSGVIYEPIIKVWYTHDCLRNETMISVVFPMINPDDVWGATHDYDDVEVFSINEGLSALNDAVSWDYPTGNLEDEVIYDWQLQAPFQFLDPTLWEINMITGTTYATAPSFQFGMKEVWTDGAPSTAPGDFNGDGVVDELDESLFLGYLSSVDGSAYDADGVVNDVVTIPNHPLDFSLFDTNGDGYVDSRDFFIGTLGDFDQNATIDMLDYAEFQACSTGPHNPALPSIVSVTDYDCRPGDFDKDGDIDLADFARFAAAQ
jgi:hypothetical protein